MATPKVVTDGSSDLDEAVLNKFLSVPKAEVKLNYCRIEFTAADNSLVVSSAVDSDGEIVTGDLSWDAGNTWVEVVLTGYTFAPWALVGLTSDNSSTNVVEVAVRAVGGTEIDILFLNSSGVKVDPDGNIKVALLVIGV